ncbi:hypothetical protein CHELA20_53657 [Hyphomicrobiales bacterium]|nr:hypothetical protein CHELA41_21269 [Hyphomicrobiales bacterium]CAH1684688.1 hypothetical protein CHELA20_53657 [Hyphomicrobiales bacterium]
MLPSKAQPWQPQGAASFFGYPATDRIARPRRTVSLKRKTRAAAQLILRHLPLANLDLKTDVHRRHVG